MNWRDAGKALAIAALLAAVLILPFGLGFTIGRIVGQHETERLEVADQLTDAEYCAEFECEAHPHPKDAEK